MDKTLLKRIEAEIAKAVDAQNIAGANALIYKDGCERYYCEGGFADIEHKVPIRRDTIFRLYSMTKPVTGAAAMLLMQRGKIDLLDPVSKYLPGFRDQRVATDDGFVPAGREVTLLDLLRMTSGLPYGRQDCEAGRQTQTVFDELDSRLGSDDPMPTVELANRLGQCALMFHPGEHWQYGTSADIMGAVIEVVSGKRYGAFLHDEFFAPLGMNDTGFFIPGDKQSRRAATYEETKNGLVPYTGSHLGITLTMEKPPAFESGGAGLASTADDYMKFAQMLLNKGVYNGARILSPKTVEYFTAAQLLPAQMTDMVDGLSGNLAGFSYGNFLRILTQPGRAVTMGSKGEYGWDGALGVYFLNSPGDDLTLVFMTQRFNAGTMPLTRRIRNLLFSALD